MTKLQEMIDYRNQQIAIFKARENERIRKEKGKRDMMLKMAKMHQDHKLSYAKIGVKFGMSRQRVYQLLKQFVADTHKPQQ